MFARERRTAGIARLLAILLVCLVFESGRAEAARPVRVAARSSSNGSGDPSSVGRVTYVSAERAYLNRGGAHGLKVGQTVKLSNGSAKVSCRIEAVSEKAATCVGGKVRRGARFQVSLPQAEKPPPRLPPLPSGNEQERRLALVQRAEVPLVGYESRPGLSRLTIKGQLYAHHETWATVSAGGGPFHGEQIHGSLGIPLAPGLRFNGDFSLWAWPRRPDESQMLQRSINMFVRRAELSYTSQGLDAQAGRVWLQSAPGLPLLDGGSVGWNSKSGDSELRAFAGSLPDAFSLAPRFDQLTAGVYGSHTIRASGIAKWTKFQARLAHVERGNGGGSRYEAETAAHFYWWNRTSASAQVLVANPSPAKAGIEAVRLSFDSQPHTRWSTRLAVRYVEGAVLDPLQLTYNPLDRKTLHADGSMRYEPINNIGFWLNAGVATQYDTLLQQRRIGAAVELLRLYGGRADLTVGHEEEFGWLRGRTTHAQVGAQPIDSLRLLARLSLFQQLETQPSAGYAGREAGMYVDGTYRVTSEYWARASLMVRRDLTPGNPYGPADPTALMGALTAGRDF